MNKILVTRYGGHGDLLMLEPVIEAIYYKHLRESGEVSITLRTFKDYMEDMKNHPLIDNIIEDDMRYQTGHHHGNDGVIRKNVGEYEYIYDFQGSIENRPGIHGVQAFACAARVAPFRQEPAFFLDENAKPCNEQEILFCNRTASDREVSEDMLEEIGLKRTYVRQPLCNNIHDFAASIKASRLVVTVDSAAAHLCAALSVPCIVIYDERFPALSRRYPYHRWVDINELDQLVQMIEDELAVDRASPGLLNKGDAGRGFKLLAHSYMAGKYLDIGPDKWPLHGAEGATLETRAANLENVPDEHYSGIYSSHCLEHVDDWQSELKLWDSKLKPGGVMALYLPHPSFEPWRPGGQWVGPWHRWAPEPVTLTHWLNTNTNMKVFEYSIRADAMKSFYILARKSLKNTWGI